MKNRGFNLVELVVVIVILGVVSSAVMQRIGNNSVFTSRAFADSLREHLRITRQAAVSWQCYTGVSLMPPTMDIVTGEVTPGTIQFFYSASDCRGQLGSDTLPDNTNLGEPMSLPIEPGVVVSDFLVIFDPVGKPLSRFNPMTPLAAPLEIRVDSISPVVIYPETGAIF